MINSLWFLIQDMYVFTVPWIDCLQYGQSLKDGAHLTQQMKWPQGRNTTPIWLSMQILQVWASFSLWFSCSRSMGFLEASATCALTPRAAAGSRGDPSSTPGGTVDVIGVIWGSEQGCCCGGLGIHEEGPGMLTFVWACSECTCKILKIYILNLAYANFNTATKVGHF